MNIWNSINTGFELTVSALKQTYNFVTKKQYSNLITILKYFLAMVGIAIGIIAANVLLLFLFSFVAGLISPVFAVIASIVLAVVFAAACTILILSIINGTVISIYEFILKNKKRPYIFMPNFLKGLYYSCAILVILILISILVAVPVFGIPLIFASQIPGGLDFGVLGKITGQIIPIISNLFSFFFMFALIEASAGRGIIDSFFASVRTVRKNLIESLIFFLILSVISSAIIGAISALLILIGFALCFLLPVSIIAVILVSFIVPAALMPALPFFWKKIKG
ncbi:hypothetical protein KAW38_04545 [Candidatus Micrarchaeota archaeon]|nr:hypothetical protein [Candidatus Micrarchaeota archaeon]